MGNVHILEIYLKKSASRGSTSSNFANAKNCVSCFHCLRNWFWTNLTVQDDTPATDIDKSKNFDTSMELLQIHTKEIENLRSERHNALEKIKKLEKTPFLWKFKIEPCQIQILYRKKCGSLWLPFWLSSSRKRYVKLKFLIKWPGHDASMQALSNVFSQYFPKLTAIIDSTEIFIDRPKTYKGRAQLYSNYKKHPSVNFLIACTSLGMWWSC